ncbi:MAG: Sporulation protein YtfJ (Spore_YtfJ) [Methanosaeta sp. PtaB.Bin039]|nr:MAG: Sporulation protein YtfJ (Spore_YtfJ) [Methanosaeta sp. PtaB.Bin039]OPY44362.1 MAG: Sporulation protein YtfJ (Spore_YtfJ) [Methanosaeta sp. PtaU1.Bin028]HOT06226.1 spore germination protein GerW family protein [Methanotrichaceae archaeon]HQF15464.1 spore germination protein GerW family protein [Methanotrichaceae archaeon]HQI90199.1 spore germination protein GerW family protein [Methanotrichaceae archaeon]
MNEVESLLRATFGEMIQVMSARTVVGDPVTLEDRTVIPLVSVGMGFGAGAGAKEYGQSGGAGGGIGIKPVAVVIIEPQGVRVEPVSSAPHSTAEKLTESVPKAIEAVANLLGKRKKEPESPPEEKEVEEKRHVSVPVT